MENRSRRALPRWFPAGHRLAQAAMSAARCQSYGLDAEDPCRISISQSLRRLGRELGEDFPIEIDDAPVLARIVDVGADQETFGMALHQRLPIRFQSTAAVRDRYRTQAKRMRAI